MFMSKVILCIAEKMGKKCYYMTNCYFYIILFLNKISFFLFIIYPFFLNAYICVCISEDRRNARVVSLSLSLSLSLGV